MLLEFRVANYRSIREEQVLSMVASTDKSHQQTHTMPTGIKSIPDVLRSAVVYGPNAGGKSNLVSALRFFIGLIRESATVVKPGQSLNVQPFLLDKDCVEEPSEFEISYIENGVRYQYGYSVTPKRVIKEWLLVYKSFKPQQWFNRYVNEKTGEDVFEFSSHLKGKRKQWAELTRDNALFLSMAAQLNSEQLLPVFNFLTNTVIVFASNQGLSDQFTISKLHDDHWRKLICEFLVSADIAIKNIKVESTKGFKNSFQLDMKTGKHDVQTEETVLMIPKFYHKTEKGAAIFELQDESQGTQRLFALAAPVIDILQKGLILIVDELDSSLHPLLVRHLMRLFNNSENNIHGAQLIVTTHDTTLLDSTLLRRDQIWFVEKNLEQASELFPLSDFSPRSNEALEKGYLSGRYGGLPMIRESSW